MTGRVTAIIADDEANLRDYLARRLAVVWPELQIVGSAASGREALACIEDHAPDIAFLDIKMPGMTGIDVASRIDPSTRVVFVTAYDEYALAAFDNAAVDYLLKPVDDDRLKRTVARLKAQGDDRVDMQALSRMLARLKPGKDEHLNWIRVGQQGETRIIPVSDVAFFKADHKYTSVQTLDAEHLIRKSIKDLAAELDPDRFWRVHRSTLVNLKFIDVARRDFRGRFTLSLKGLRTTLKVSDTYAHLFRQM